MYSKISTVHMELTEWLEQRKQGIGGSDAGAVCGLNPYASPMSVYQDKTSPEIRIQENEAMRQGRDLEDYVAKRFMEATGFKVRRSNVMYTRLCWLTWIAWLWGRTLVWSVRPPAPSSRISGRTGRSRPIT